MSVLFSFFSSFFLISSGSNSKVCQSALRIGEGPFWIVIVYFCHSWHLHRGIRLDCQLARLVPLGSNFQLRLSKISLWLGRFPLQRRRTASAWWNLRQLENQFSISLKICSSRFGEFLQNIQWNSRLKPQKFNIGQIIKCPITVKPFIPFPLLGFLFLQCNYPIVEMFRLVSWHLLCWLFWMYPYHKII